MITEKVKNLFAFIDFLHSKTAYFVSKKPLIDEFFELKNRQRALRADENYKVRIEFNKIQAETERQFDIVAPQTRTIIFNKASELNIAPSLEPNLNLSAQSDLFELKRNFEECDLFQIIEAKRKYLKFRTDTDYCHYFLQMFFTDLDRDLKEFFDYFKEDTEQNEYKYFGREEIQVNSIEELITAMKYNVNSYVPVDSNFNPTQTNNTIHSENTFLNAKQRIDKRPASEAKSFALSIYFENISTFIDYYTNEAKASDKGLGQKADLFLNKCKNRSEDCDTENEFTSLLSDCVKGKGEMFNIINNSYENQYKKEFNFFSFNESNSFDWEDKQDTITHIKYYLEYKYLINAVNNKLSVMKKKDDYLASYLGLKPEFPFYELDFIPQYYESKRNIYLAERKSLLGRAFVDRSEIEIFKKNEIQECVNVIDYYSNLFRTRPEVLETHKAFVGKTAYKLWLDSLVFDETFPPQSIARMRKEFNKTELSETHQKPTPALKEFISENLDKALIINLLDYPLINDVLQRQKDKLRDAEFESEFSEINEFAIKGIKEIKNRLQLHLRNYPDNPYKNGFDLVLLDIHLFHEYNEIYNKSLNPSTVQQQPNIEPFPSQTIEKQKPELKIDQIALKYAYEGLQITRDNGNVIAKEYGHNSGEKLFQRFTYFSSSANRKGKPSLCTPKKLDNKIKLIESIIKLLPIDKQERAKDELLILKKIYEAEYQ